MPQQRPALAKHVETASGGGGVRGFPGAAALTSEQFYGIPVDLFIPAALDPIARVYRQRGIFP
jgi:glutamate dehydrogenase/leucine dehydrogenase